MNYQNLVTSIIWKEYQISKNYSNAKVEHLLWKVNLTQKVERLHWKVNLKTINKK